METQNTLNSQCNLDKEKRAEVPGLRLYHKAIVIKTVCYTAQKHTSVNDRRERIEINPYTVYTHLILAYFTHPNSLES